MIGTSLRQYRIVAALGAGGMGVVYRARDERLDRDVAIKLLPQEALADEERRRRFHREALALSRLSHPAIATVHAFESEQGVDFLVMEWVEGRTLEAMVADGPLDLDDVRELGTQIAEALAAAHEQGVIHRDLKPANVMVTPGGHVKLLDFGLARLLEEPPRRADAATESNILAGTVPYMAPELLLGQSSGPACDLYALGALLFEMATGRTPHRAEPATALVYEIIHTPAPAPSSMRPGIDATFDHLVLALLEKDPAARPPDARSVVEALRDRSPGGPAPGTPGTIRAIAVLPFEDLSADPGRPYLADGMTEALIAELARLQGVRVISRTSAMAYKGSRRPLPEIARALRVDAVVEGSVVHDGVRLDVSARLVEAATDATLWAERYQRALTDVLALHHEIAVAVAAGIRLRVAQPERALLAVPRSVSPSAYECYLRGRHFWEQRTPDSVTRALESFQRAIDDDPTYALAWTGVADCHNIRGAFRWMKSADCFPRGKAAALRALALDPDLGEAHTSLAFSLVYYEWDWDGAGRTFARALELQPGYANARQWYGEYLVSLGRFDAARIEGEHAAELDPLSAVIAVTVGDVHYYSRRHEVAIAEYRRALDLSPGFQIAEMNTARALEELGRHDEAIAGFTQSLERHGADPQASPALAHAHAVAGHDAEARRILDRVLERARGGSVSPYAIATVYAGLRDVDAAFEWLARAADERDRMMVQLLVHPRLDPLRADARFDGLLARVGLAR